MKKLILDLGNTRDKIAVFRGSELAFCKTKDRLEGSFLRHLLESEVPTSCIISSTGTPRKDLADLIKSAIPCIVLDHTVTLPFENLYGTPQTLGRDRIAVLAGGLSHFQNGPFMVIDAGTCITIDALDEQNRYFGGIISPGIHMRLKAMHTLTARLPLVDFAPAELPVPLQGPTTKGSLLSGAINGALFETRAIIEEYRLIYKDLKVLITGGDAALFETLLKSEIFAFPNLVLEGLNLILDNNVAQTA